MKFISDLLSILHLELTSRLTASCFENTLLFSYLNSLNSVLMSVGSIPLSFANGCAPNMLFLLCLAARIGAPEKVLLVFYVNTEHSCVAELIEA